MREYTGKILEADYLIPISSQDKIPDETPKHKYLKESLDECITNNPYIGTSTEVHDPKARWINDIRKKILPKRIG